MKVLLSWSGERSRSVALALRTWLSDVNQSLRPWMSEEDISKGGRWAEDLARQLQDTDIGIVCVTRENMSSPWVTFESGVLSKGLTNSLVCTYLFGLKYEEMSKPLSIFQHTYATREDTRRLIHTLNSALGSPLAREPGQVNRTFDLWWPQLEAALAAIPVVDSVQSAAKGDREVLDEILEIVRASNLREDRSLLPVRSGRLDLSDLFAGSDIERLVRRVASLVTNEHSHEDDSADWIPSNKATTYATLDGQWHSRWNGGIASATWVEGFATCMAAADIYLMFLFQDWKQKGSVYALVCRRDEQDQLVGRYINLDFPEDSTPWVGKLLSNRRIDGYWTEGRWDFRR